MVKRPMGAVSEVFEISAVDRVCFEGVLGVFGTNLDLRLARAI